MALPYTFANATTATGAQLDANFSTLDTNINAISLSSGSSLVGFIQAGTGAVAETVQSKLRRVVDVLDFGADSSGVTSSSANFTSSGSTGATHIGVCVPPGIFNLSTTPTPTGQVTWTIQTGASFTGAGKLKGMIINQDQTLGVMSILDNRDVANLAGQSCFKVGICAGTENGWLINPAVNNWVSLGSYISSSATRNSLWSYNPIVDINHAVTSARGIELDINSAFAAGTTPYSSGHQLGLDIVSGSTFSPSAAIAINSSLLTNRFNHGIWFQRIGGNSGSTLIHADGGVSVDYGIDLSLATVNFQGIRIGSVPDAVVAGASIRQLANGNYGLFLQRFTDSAPTGNLLACLNAANTTVLSKIDASGNVFGSSLIATSAAVGGGAGTISMGATVATTVGAAGGASALPATPLGYAIWNVAGTTVKVPYYNN